MVWVWGFSSLFRTSFLVGVVSLVKRMNCFGYALNARIYLEHMCSKGGFFVIILNNISFFGVDISKFITIPLIFCSKELNLMLNRNRMDSLRFW